MSVSLVRTFALSAASLIWLAGCDTTSLTLPPPTTAGIADPLASNADPQATAATPEAGTSASEEITSAVPGARGVRSAGAGAAPELLGTDPNDDLSVAKKYFRQGGFGLAERYFRRAVELHPRNAEAWVGLAASYDRLRRFDLADRAYRQVLKMIGPTPEVLNNQGYSYMLRGDYRRARTTLLAARSKSPENPYIRNNLELLDESERKAKTVN
jgi:tetratricopeptide (TPR) repeat protein